MATDGPLLIPRLVLLEFDLAATMREVRSDEMPDWNLPGVAPMSAFDWAEMLATYARLN